MGSPLADLYLAKYRVLRNRHKPMLMALKRAEKLLGEIKKETDLAMSLAEKRGDLQYAAEMQERVIRINKIVNWYEEVEEKTGI